MSEFTTILAQVQDGRSNAAEQIFPLVYEELRRIAAQKMAEQPPGQTLQPTALVHEAWLKLNGNAQPTWHDRRHFVRAAAQAMRQILIDRARARQCVKRGAARLRVELVDVDLATSATPEIILLVDEALEALARAHPDKAELVKLRFYAGLSVAEAASALGFSEKTVKRHWIYARAWLFREIQRLAATSL